MSIRLMQTDMSELILFICKCSTFELISSLKMPLLKLDHPFQSVNISPSLSFPTPLMLALMVFLALLQGYAFLLFSLSGAGFHKLSSFSLRDAGRDASTRYFSLIPLGMGR